MGYEEASHERGWKRDVTPFELSDSQYDNPEVLCQIEVLVLVLLEAFKSVLDMD